MKAGQKAQVIKRLREAGLAEFEIDTIIRTQNKKRQI